MGFISSRQVRPLAATYTAETAGINEQSWYQLLAEFEDANIYQTWSYAQVIAGRRNISHLLLKKAGDTVAIAEARIKKLPLLDLGIAYVYWGPIWRRRGTEPNPDVFRQAIRALRNEFVCRRGLSLRLFPSVFYDDPRGFSAILTEEGFASQGEETRGRTILMDLAPSIAKLREGMNPHWKRELKIAERNTLDVSEGSDDKLFAQFIEIYREMVARKRFVEPNDINQFARIQSQLPEHFKMRVMLGKAGSNICAGAIYSVIGDSAIYLFGATSNTGLKSRGSYALQWKLIELLKTRKTATYNLNGVNPVANPGTYKFKNDLAGQNGKDVYYLGRFETHAGPISRFAIGLGGALRSNRKRLQTFARYVGSPKAQVGQPEKTLCADSATSDISGDPRPSQVAALRAATREQLGSDCVPVRPATFTN